MGKLIEIKNLYVGYDKLEVLRDASLTINNKDFIGIIGPNGGGKTTLLKAILGLMKPTKGEIIYHISKEEIGYLPQINRFDAHFPATVLDVVLSGISDQKKWYRPFAKEQKLKATEICSELGIENLASKAIGELSGGQMQRVFLGRALISEPKLIILDEPDTFVDNKFEAELYEKLRELNKKVAILLVSHDVGTISTYVKSIACVSGELHYHPSNIISAEQLASYNCPIQIITHGKVPHTVLGDHHHTH